MEKDSIIAKLKKLEGQVAEQETHKKQRKQNVAMILITELIAGIFVGAILGYYADEYFNTLPVFLATFTICGFFASLFNIYRSFDRNYKN
jgi:F0F1-type ATP synthase assembly protein I